MAENTMTKTHTAPFASCKKADKPYVFISYAHADKKKVYKIITQLYESGINIWYDEGIELGREYDTEIASAVANCDMFLIFLSNKSVASDYVFNEFTYARVNKKTILPCYLEDINPAPEHEDRFHGIKMHTKGKKIPVKKLPKLLVPCKIFGKRKATPITVNSQAPKVMKDFEYEIKNNGIVITKYTGSDSEVVIPESHNGIPVTAIGRSAFYCRTELTSITIPDSVTEISNLAFDDYISLTSISISDIGSYDFFKHCDLLTIKCEENSAAHKYAEENHIKFEIIEIEHKEKSAARKDETEKFTYLCYAKNDFEKLKNLFDSLKTEGYRIRPHECGEDSRESDRDMLMCSEFIPFLSKAAVDNGILESIKFARSNNKGEFQVLLEECDLPHGFNMNYIGKQQLHAMDNSEHDFDVKLRQYLAKHDCAPKTVGMVIPDFEYTINSNDTITLTKYIGKGGNVTIPSEYFDPPKKIAVIDDLAFWCCTGLTSVIIPNSINSIGDYAFAYCKRLTAIDVDKNNSNYTCQDGILFSKDLTKLIYYPAGKLEKSYCIPNSVASIGNYAFSGCTRLTSVTIPDSVTTIGDMAFNGCTKLTIYGSSGSYAEKFASKNDIPFKSTDTAKQVIDSTLPAKKHHGKGGNVTIPSEYFDPTKKITAINDSAFLNNSAFKGCTGLTSVTIPDSVTEIGGSAFANCSGLTSITIPDSVTSIGSLAFECCTGLTSVVIPDSVTEIGSSAFANCTGLTSITIPNSVNKIGDRAFGDCTGLISVIIPDSVTEIGNFAFKGCKKLTIYGSSGSYAEKYAAKNKIPFKATDIEETITDSTPPVKKRRGKGWLITALILAILIGAGFTLQYFGIIDFQELIDLLKDLT